MKTKIAALASLILMLAACQKEVTEQKISSAQSDQATVANDTVYFEGNSFTGGIAITSSQNFWGDAYTDYFRLPYKDGCKIAYARFKINIQKGCVITSMQVNVDDTIKKVRRFLQNKPAGSTVALKYDIPQPIITTYDNADPRKHKLNCFVKVQGPDHSWSRVMPDSISILGADNKPLPIKGFLHSDWPKGTPLVWKNVILN